MTLASRLRLYLVTDERADEERLLGAVEAALAGGVTAVQLRRKEASGRELVRVGRRLRDLCWRYGALFFVNDRIDVAQVTGADGVHLGQEDLDLADVRTLVPRLLVGISAATVAEAERAWRGGADYLGVGAIFPTPSKPDADVCGIAGLRSIRRRVALPLVAIGGLTAERARAVREAGADGIAVISAILSAPDPKRAAEILAAAGGR